MLERLQYYTIRLQVTSNVLRAPLSSGVRRSFKASHGPQDMSEEGESTAAVSSRRSLSYAKPFLLKGCLCLSTLGSWILGCAVASLSRRWWCRARLRTPSQSAFAAFSSAGFARWAIWRPSLHRSCQSRTAGRPRRARRPRKVRVHGWLRFHHLSSRSPCMHQAAAQEQRRQRAALAEWRWRGLPSGLAPGKSAEATVPRPQSAGHRRAYQLIRAAAQQSL